MAPPTIWLLDPDRRWGMLDLPLTAATGLPAPADAEVRFVDGGHHDALWILANDGHAAPVIALLSDRSQRVEALAWGADAVATAGDLGPERLPDLIDDARARRAAMHRRLRRRAAELGAADHTLESVGRSVSHDLRAPLRTLDGFGQALIEDFGDALDPDARMYLDRMLAATARLDERLSAMVRLTGAIRRPFRARTVDLGALADEAIARHRDAEPERVVAWSRSDDLTATGDPALIGMLVGELIANAWRFTGDRPAASITLGRVDGAFRIEDDGAGFGPGYAEKILHLFGRYHTPDEFPGEGVGLAIARCVVERHGGWITAEGEDGVGARFTFALDPDHPRPAG